MDLKFNMLTKYSPSYRITSKIARDLMRIEALKERILHFSLSAPLQLVLGQIASLYTVHYSTMIEGNRLELSQIDAVLNHSGHFPGYERDEEAVKGYHAALAQIEEWKKMKHPINEKVIQVLHTLVMGNGQNSAKISSYREEQNLVYNIRTNAVVYMPPEAKDVSSHLKALFHWIKENSELPCPILAAIANYQLTSILPYCAGNGRTARLLTTLILNLNQYDVKGLYSLEEYYVENLNAYFDAISLSPSHKYYEGRVENDMTPWVQYFVEGMAVSLEKALERIVETELHAQTMPTWKCALAPKQRKAISFFQEFVTIKASSARQKF